ncbi:MAG: hypothetical protein ACHRHE_20345 [Tepidisphaerales bacterium]
MDKLQAELSAVASKAAVLERKIIESDPLRQPILSASATVEVVIASSEKVSANFMDRGGYCALCRADQALLVTSSTQSNGNQIGGDRVSYRSVFSLDRSGAGFGTLVSSLAKAEYVQIEFLMLPENAKILGGHASLVLNSATTIVFDIPAQVANQRRVFVRSISTELAKVIPKN